MHTYQRLYRPLSPRSTFVKTPTAVSPSLSTNPRGLSIFSQLSHIDTPKPPRFSFLFSLSEIFSLRNSLLALGFQLNDKVQIFVNTKRFQGLRVNQNVSISHSAFWVLFDYYYYYFFFFGFF